MNYLQKGVLYGLLSLGSLGFVGQSNCESLESKVEDLRRVSVVGSAQIEVPPDAAIIRLSVKTEKKDLIIAQQDNAIIATKVVEALKAKGVEEKELETVSYSIEKTGYWDPKTNQRVDTGYLVTNSLKVTTMRLNSIGALVDAAVQAGANDVNGISFDLTQESKEKLKYELLTKACEDAKQKAKLMTSCFGGMTGKIITISESNYQISRPDYGMKAMRVDAETPVQPKNVSTSGSVSVMFEVDYPLPEELHDHSTAPKQ